MAPRLGRHPSPQCPGPRSAADSGLAQSPGPSEAPTPSLAGRKREPGLRLWGDAGTGRRRPGGCLEEVALEQSLEGAARSPREGLWVLGWRAGGQELGRGLQTPTHPALALQSGPPARGVGFPEASLRSGDTALKTSSQRPGTTQPGCPNRCPWQWPAGAAGCGLPGSGWAVCPLPGQGRGC